MANSQPFRSTPQLGQQLNVVETGLPYWDNIGPANGGITSPSYKLGNKEVGNDGADYIYVQASAAISATATTGTQVTITFPAYTVATGAGGYYTPPGVAIASGSYFHVRKNAYNAVP